jgi:cell division protein FtsI (penicillin-binding protein 3)/stage V sporulation protein D (sporulation-specific penicillin-binding protein)
VRSIRGITFIQDAERVYPNGSLGCHVVGFINSDHKGVAGIEEQEDQYLRGHEGYRTVERDRAGHELAQFHGEERLPQDGCNVRLNLDLTLQNIAETELDEACKEFKPIKAIAIIMRPQTGEILAMANRPNFDPNDLLTKPAAEVKSQMGATDNCAISDMMEPGSTFKIVTAAGVLNEHLVQPDTTIYCENGAFSYAGRILHDDHPNGDLTVEDILVKSSNIGAAKLALILGDQRFFGYIRSFGFGDRTGIALPGEISGWVATPNKWTPLSITRIAMGQEVTVTPLQTITAMCAIANGGSLMMPQIVHDITDDNGQVLATFPPVKVRQVVSPAESREEVKALEGVVSQRGTAALAKVSGFTVAGKTGTAQKAAPKGKGYLAGQHVVSFCGFLPAENPAFACMVMLDDPKTPPEQDYGGMVAAPVFSRIAEKAARYMNLEPQPEEPAGDEVITQRDHD